MTDVRVNSSIDYEDQMKATKKMRFSLNDSDIQSIWDSVSEFIESTMLKQKGVNIPNLGIFSFNQIKLDVGQSKYLLIQRPLFVLSEKICQTHGLKQHKVQITGSVPVVPLNYASIMIQSNGQFHRDHIETCVRELITATNQAIAGQGSTSTEFVFTRIGRLQIRMGAVKFKFYKSFINNLENGCSVIKTMQNRPGTADSVMSERPPTRPFSNVLPLPRITSRHPPRLPSIHEQEMFETNQLSTSRQDCEVRSGSDVLQIDNEHHNHELKLDLDPLSSEMIENEPVEQLESSSKHEEYVQHEDSTQVDEGVNYQNNIVNLEMSLNDNEEDKLDTASTLPKPKPPPSTTSSTSHSRKQTYDQLSVGPLNRPHSSTSTNRTNLSSSCSHRITPHQQQQLQQQQLCYVCHQRERRNVPVYTTELEKTRDLEEDRVLQSFQNMKDQEHLAKEHEKMLSRKHENQKAAAYNIGIAEAKKSQETFKDPNMYRSYIFEYRPLTPPRIFKQNQLSHELSRQVEEKSSKKKKYQDDESFIQRLEQMQLAEDLAKQREQFLNNREKQKDIYKKALDAQMNNKPSPLPRYEPDSTEPVFGKNDVTQEKIIAKRQKAQEVLKQQMEAAEEKKRNVLLKKLQEQNHEEKVLSRVKQDLLEDRAQRYERMVHNRVRLENEWETAKKEKKERDMVERLKLSMADDVLLHEQCDQYHRCAQCKRKIANEGSSNIWKETYFVPGTRYIY